MNPNPPRVGVDRSRIEALVCALPLTLSKCTTGGRFYTLGRRGSEVTQGPIESGTRLSGGDQRPG